MNECDATEGVVERSGRERRDAAVIKGRVCSVRILIRVALGRKPRRGHGVASDADADAVAEWRSEKRREERDRFRSEAEGARESTECENS